MHKKRIVVRITLLITIILITLIGVQAQTNPCTENTENTCGYPITQTGHGAVELCEYCYVCGAEDGICPAWYSTGERHENPVEVLVRKGTQDRLNVSDDKTIVHNTPQQACESIGGTFQAPARVRNQKEDDWQDDATKGATTPMSEETQYIKARCVNVPIRPSCDECIDVDCITELKGAVYTQRGGGYEGLKNATVILGSDKYHFNEEYERRNRTNEDGEYEILNAYMGNVEITCLADGFKPKTKSVKLVPGNNIVDCELEEDTCTQDCYYAASGICSKDCEGFNECEFPTDEIKDACHSRPQGFVHVFNANPLGDGLIEVNETVCCNNDYRTREVSEFRPQPSNLIRNLITRSYSKIFLERPTDLKIIVYDK